MATILDDLLAERGTLLADGAMGTALFGLGLTTGDSPEFWNVDHPDRIASVHQSYVDAGSDLFLTNTFGGNRYRLKLHEAQHRVGEVNRAGARIGREVADRAGRKVLVAGSMGPTGEIFQPVGTLAHEDGESAFAEQAEALAEGGVDVLWIETMSAAEEVAAAVRGAARTGLPIVVTMSFDTNGRTMMGLTPEGALEMSRGLAAPVSAFGANCGIGPSQLLATVLGFGHTATPGEIVVAKGNCGIPEYREGAIHYSGTPDIMYAYARMSRDAGARIVGGCCGTTAVHVAAMRKALDDPGRGPSPSVVEIEAAFGPVVMPSIGGEPRERRGRRHRGHDHA